MSGGIDKKPTVHFHEDSKLHYLAGKDRVLFENGVTMPRFQFDRTQDKSDPTNIVGYCKDVLEEQNPDNTGYDWKYACSTGKLRHRKVLPDLVVSTKSQRKFRKQVAAASAVKQEEQKKKALHTWVFSSVFLVMAVMAIVGVGSAIMSAYHTSAFLIQGGKPTWTAVLTGTMLILFSGTAFTAARYFLQENGWQRSFGFLFIIAGFAVIAYSIFSTVTVNFNQFKWVDDAKDVVAVEDSEALAAHERLLVENKEALNAVERRLGQLQAEAYYWRDKSWRRYDEFQLQIVAAVQEQGDLGQRRIALESSRPEIVAQAAESRETVYTFLARLLGLPEDTARFFVYIVPACLYDVLAPFALSVVLLLVDRRRKIMEDT